MLEDYVADLDRSGFVPPRRVETYQPAAGDHARVLDKFREKYREICADVLHSEIDVLDDLSVLKVLESGVLVQHGRRTPFVVRKTHLAQVAE